MADSSPDRGSSTARRYVFDRRLFIIPPVHWVMPAAAVPVFAFIDNDSLFWSYYTVAFVSFFLLICCVRYEIRCQKEAPPVLDRFDKKRVKITAEDGSVFAGRAEAYPSGYGLHVFGREEESLLIGGTHVFLTDIRRIELLDDGREQAIPPRRYDDLMGSLLERPYWIADILPEQVPENADGQFFAVERYYLQPARLGALRRRFAEILLRLNCYCDMAVSFDNCESWALNPDPEEFAERLAALSGNTFLRAIFASQETMIDIEPTDTYMTVYDPKGAFLDRLRKLAEAEGLFVWQPPAE